MVIGLPFFKFLKLQPYFFYNAIYIGERLDLPITLIHEYNYHACVKIITRECKILTDNVLPVYP